LSGINFLPARKGLGQNFLHDQRVIENIVASLNPKKNDLVVEIGPGRGALTGELMQSGCDLHLIEFDRDLADYWRDQAAGNAALTLHEADVLKFDFGSLMAEGSLSAEGPLSAEGSLPAEGSIRVIGNLPYNISSPVLFRLLEVREKISDMVLMFQKEVVDRMVAGPGSKQFGRLSVMLQQASSCERIMDVSPGAFSPPPKVKSSVVRIVPHTIPAFALTEESVFGQVVKQAFSMRRKTLRNSLREWLDAADYETLDLNSGQRPEQLAVVEFVALANFIAKQKVIKNNTSQNE
jgi:16S rRNA (adenine1518-N6/adenine1519-N6)-dimethyltransferase